MATVSERVDIGTRNSSPLRGILLGIVLIAAELLWARLQDNAAQQFLAHMPWWRDHLRPVQWLFVSMPFLILALAVGLGARSARRAVIAVGLSFAAAAVAIASYELLNYLFTHSSPGLSTVKAVDYATVMLLSTLAALAWCYSRRYGAAWLPAVVLVAAIGAGVVRWWVWPPRLSSLDGDWLFVVRTGLEILPILAACLVAWTIELKSNRAA